MKLSLFLYWITVLSSLCISRYTLSSVYNVYTMCKYAWQTHQYTTELTLHSDTPCAHKHALYTGDTRDFKGQFWLRDSQDLEAEFRLRDTRLFKAEFWLRDTQDIEEQFWLWLISLTKKSKMAGAHSFIRHGNISFSDTEFHYKHQKNTGLCVHRAFKKR